MVLVKPNPLKALKEFVTAQCRKNHTSQAAVAKKMGMLPQHLSRNLAGNVDVGIEFLARLADALGVTPAYLLASEQERKRLDSLPEMGMSPIEERLQALENIIKPQTKSSVSPQNASGHERLERAILQMRSLQDSPQLKSLLSVIERYVPQALAKKKSG